MRFNYCIYCVVSIFYNLTHFKLYYYFIFTFFIVQLYIFLDVGSLLMIKNFSLLTLRHGIYVVIISKDQLFRC
jgi:hypothetical protein